MRQITSKSNHRHAVSLQKIFGIITFEEGVFCARDALGQRATTAISGVPGHLATPSLPTWTGAEPSPLDMPLLAPDAARGWQHGEKPIWWGRPWSYPEGLGRVERMLLEFDVAQDDLRTAATKLHRGFDQWLRRFIDFLEIKTQRGARSPSRVEAVATALDLFTWNDSGKIERPYNESPATIHVVVGIGWALTRDQFVSVSKLAGRENSPPLEHALQLGACRALRDGDYRKALVETSTSAEVVLTAALNRHLAGTPHGALLLEQFRMLGKRFQLAEKVGLHIPKLDYRALVVEPRNAAVHGGSTTNEEQARKAVNAVNELLKLHSPLSEIV